MIYASCRKNFEDVDEFDVLRLKNGDFESGSDHYDLGLLTGVRTVQVHGYNSLYTNCADAYRSNSELMRECHFFPQQPLGFMWPGLGEDPLQSLLFHKAQGMADKSAPYLRDLVEKINLQTLPLSSNVVIIAHSLGCRVALEAVKLGARPKALVLLGAAVDDNSLGKTYPEQSVPIHVFWSRRDGVLNGLYKFDQFFHQALGGVGPRTPLPWVTSHDVSQTVSGHNEYRHDRGIWQAISKLL